MAQEIWDSESVPEEMVLAIMRNLRKNRSAQNDWDGYRPISLLTSTYKIFSTLIYLRILREVEGYISKWQAGFKRRRGYVDNVVVLLELLRVCKERGLRIFVTKTDIKHAFDSLDHAAIFRALRRAGASRKSIAMVMYIYAKAKAVILAGKACGWVFTIAREVLQGGHVCTLNFGSMNVSIFMLGHS